MLLLRLFWEFFKIGIFAVGGGMAAIPFLQDLAAKTGWYDQSLITTMIAVSESTPGPIGINMATYVGNNVAGVIGGITATLGVIIPSIIIVTVISKFLEKFKSSKIVSDIFYGLRPAVTGLIAAAGIGVVKVAMFHLDVYEKTGAIMDLFDIKKIIYFVLAYLAIIKFKLHPIIYIAISAVVGIVLPSKFYYFCNRKELL